VLAGAGGGDDLIGVLVCGLASTTALMAESTKAASLAVEHADVMMLGEAQDPGWRAGGADGKADGGAGTVAAGDRILAPDAHADDGSVYHALIMQWRSP